MSSTSDTESLAGAAWSFLERALEELVPERDVPASRALCRRIVKSWPTEEQGWQAARDSLAKALCERLAGQPQSWARAIDLVSIYLDRVEFDAPHPQQTDTTLHRRGQRVYVIEFGLPLALTTALLAESTIEMRARLYDALDGWRSWQIVAAALAAHPLSFDSDEISLLLTRGLRFSEGDMAAGELLDTLLESLQASIPSADALLESWFERMDLEPKVVGLLALWRLPQRDGVTALRQRLVHQFLRLPPQQGARLALHVAYRSWPAGAVFDDRRAALIECLDYLGPEGLLPALAALTRDRNTKPEQALALHDAIVARIDDASQLDPLLANQRVELLRWLSNSWPKDLSLDVAAFVARLPPAAAFPAEEQHLHLLDWLLSQLAHREAAPVQAYVLNWIEAQAGAFHLQGLERLLPSTRERLPGARWLVEAAVSRRPALRVGALGCLVHSKRPQPDDFDSLTEPQVLALTHLLLAEAGLGAGLIDFLFALARARVDCIDALMPLLGGEALRTYPGQYERNVANWAAAVEGRAEGDVERRTVAQLQGLLDARLQRSEAKRALAEALFERSSPTRRPAVELLARAFHQGLNESNALFLQIATKVPIACGAASAFESGDADARAPQPFKEVGGEAELPLLGGYDPIAADYFGFVHQQQADRLLAADEEQSS